RQLDHARSAAAGQGISPPLVLATARSLPFPNASFDVVFCDHGATTFASPEATVAEASRLLRPDGLLAFCMSTPIRDMCWHARAGRITRRLEADYFGMYAGEDEKFI